MGDCDGGDFAGTICSICYEVLKPITEDLQSINICGHVFHELCLQQWFEYCSTAKKCTCPVCKQSCKASDVARLYFQSLGDVKDAVLPEKLIGSEEEDAGVLRREVKMLALKVSGLSSKLEQQGKKLGDVTDEELEKSTLECSRLQDRNMALAKELVAFKLVVDPNLDEDEVLKLATLGNGANSKDTIDTLRRSLVMRNRSYKELMTKCNILGRAEARYSRKLEKAKEKVKKLKERIQELETAAEVKENEILRSLKVSKKAGCLKNLENNSSYNSDLLSADKISSKENGKQILTPHSRADLSANVNNNVTQSARMEDIDCKQIRENKDVNFSKENSTWMSLNGEENYISLDEDDSEFAKALPGSAKYNGNDHDSDSVALRKPIAKSEAASIVARETAMQEDNRAEPLRVDVNNEFGKNTAGTMPEDVTLPDNVKQVQTIVNIRKENLSPLPLSSPGDICFSGGLLGPDGTNRYLGRWCKRGQKNESVTPKASISGDLIAVGADGRGGKVKVLRSPNQTFQDCKENSIGSKRLKFGPKANSMQSQGCLQIEHFFGRISH
ncbi:E3 ubiquitin-protein ligase TRAIP isoform X2 [Neltuma alba]|uniref:E3 ubiquitin-protein ligase TRAIP isoform X2 n=1 Tax=Neltuma alba TaxID=207710 RepID=UPI0010A5134D|nr:E3 ubiquitin-protein ligase TRAIP isoform X2 [Prosopis alba]